MRYYPRNLASLANLTSKGDARYPATSGIQLTETPEGYTAVATDGRRLAVVKGTNDAPPDKFFELAQVAAMPNGGHTAVVDAQLFAAALKGIGKPGKRSTPEESEQSAVLVIPAPIHRDNGEVTQPFPGLATLAPGGATVQVIDTYAGRYPNWPMVMPRGEPVAQIDVDPALLLDVLKAAQAIGGESPNGNKRVTIKIFAGHDANLLGINTSNPTQEFTGLVVPLRS